MQYIIATVLLSMAALSQAQVFSLGKCPEVSVQQDFQVQAYLGQWFELARFPTFFQRNQLCGQALYKLKENGHIDVNNTNFKTTGETESAIGDARIDDPAKKEGKLGVRFSNFQPYGAYWVLETDYTSSSVVYSCSNYLGLFKSEFLWILARTPQLPRQKSAHIESLVRGYGIKYEKLVRDDFRSSCGLVH